MQAIPLISTSLLGPAKASVSEFVSYCLVAIFNPLQAVLPMLENKVQTDNPLFPVINPS